MEVQEVSSSLSAFSGTDHVPEVCHEDAACIHGCKGSVSDIPDVLVGGTVPSHNLLKSVMEYQNSAVVHRYTDKLGLTASEAEALFDDTKQFLYLCGTKGKGSPALSPTAKVDAGWHEFILFTEDYQAFCLSLFGRFIHHRPVRPEDPKGDGRDLRATVELAAATFGRLSDNWQLRSQDNSTCVQCDGGGCNEPECHGDDPVMPVTGGGLGHQ